MGLFSWLFPSPEDRVKKAKYFLEIKRPDEARLEILDVDHPEAQAVLEEAENQLALANMAAATRYARQGDTERSATHMELAERFHHGGQEEAFRAARREMREIREEQAAEVKRKALAAEARLLGSAPPLDEDAERLELEARLGLIVENYHPPLKEGVAALGADFAEAALALGDGQAEEALRLLVALPDEAPLVQWERARAAQALGDPKAAARALKRFVELVGEHVPMGGDHSATRLAQALAESGQVAEALAVLKGARRGAPKLGSVLYAQLLEAQGELAEAEAVLKQVIADHPRTDGAYVLLARVRLAGGHKLQAMRALEASIQVTVCTPGKCGYKPPDLTVHRMLALLYLEEGIETERALELADTAASLVQQPTWEDLYLATLAAKVGHRSEAKQLSDRLREVTPREGPAAEKLQLFLSTSET